MFACEQKASGRNVEVEDDVRIDGVSYAAATREEVIDILTCAIVRLVLDGKIVHRLKASSRAQAGASHVSHEDSP